MQRYCSAWFNYTMFTVYSILFRHEAEYSFQLTVYIVQFFDRVHSTQFTVQYSQNIRWISAVSLVLVNAKARRMLAFWGFKVSETMKLLRSSLMAPFRVTTPLLTRVLRTTMTPWFWISSKAVRMAVDILPFPSPA